MPLVRFAALALFAALLATPSASAGGGRYVFDGGSPAQQAQVRAALAASAFDWSIVPGTVTIHIRRGIESHASPGEIWLNADLLDSGRFAWGVVQHEFAHQVDFLLLDADKRRRLFSELGGKDWCYAVPGLAHDDYGCERFASVLAWSYWPSKDNSMRPTSPHDEAAAMAPARFRALLGELLATPRAAAMRSATDAAPSPQPASAYLHRASPSPSARAYAPSRRR